MMFCKTLGDVRGDIGRCLDFFFGKPNDLPSMLSNEAVFSSILLFVLMPVRTVNLYRQSLVGNGKVDGIASKSRLLLVSKPDGIKGKAHLFFKQCLSVMLAVASERAKLFSGFRFAPKFAAAILARFNYRRPSAFLRTIIARSSLFAREHFATPIARFIGCSRQSALAATNGVSVSVRGGNGKCFPALWADFINTWSRCIVAFPRTKRALLRALGAAQGLMTHLTRHDGWGTPNVVTRLRTEGVHRLNLIFFFEWRMALSTGVVMCHGIQPLTNTLRLYHER